MSQKMKNLFLAMILNDDQEYMNKCFFVFCCLPYSKVSSSLISVEYGIYVLRSYSPSFRPSSSTITGVPAPDQLFMVGLYTDISETQQCTMFLFFHRCNQSTFNINSWYIRPTDRRRMNDRYRDENDKPVFTFLASSYLYLCFLASLDLIDTTSEEHVRPS